MTSLPYCSSESGLMRHMIHKYVTTNDSSSPLGSNSLCYSYSYVILFWKYLLLVEFIPIQKQYEYPLWNCVVDILLLIYILLKEGIKFIPVDETFL